MKIQTSWMRQILVATLALSGMVSAASGQQFQPDRDLAAKHSYRSSGWGPSQQSTREIAGASSVYQANFQAQRGLGSGSVVPPTTGLPTLPLPQGAGLPRPSSLPNYAAAGGTGPLPQSVLPPAGPRSTPVLPPPTGGAQSVLPPPGMLGQGYLAAQADRTLGQQTPAQPATYRPPVGSGQLRPQQNRVISTPPSTPLRSPPSTRPAAAFATGQPYVSAPRRTGNFATSAYRPLTYQMAAYQRAVPANPRPQSALQGGVGRLASGQTQLPSTSGQLQPQQSLTRPGVYPTQYNATNCSVGPGFPSRGVSGSYAPGTITPNLVPNLYSANNSGYAPLFSLGQENYNVQLGRGLVGQPTVYVPGQPVRNFMRYVFP